MVLGCIIYELFTLNNYSKSKFFNKIEKIDEENYDSKWQRLIDSLLQNEYNKRPNINQVYKSLFPEDIKIKINEKTNEINNEKDFSKKIIENKNQQIENIETENNVKITRINDLEIDENVYNLDYNICINKIIELNPIKEEIDRSLSLMSKNY